MKLKKKRTKCLFCNTEVLNSASVYCNHICFNNHRYEQYIQRWKQGLESGLSGKQDISNYIRRFLHERSCSMCEKCGWSEVHPVTLRIPLTINHIDGNHLNNTLENLELICPNCHSLTPNYGALNKGNGRKLRRLKHQ